MTAETLSTFLLTLAARRKRLNMPLDVLARRSGVGRATVCRLLSGDNTNGSFLHVAALADALGVKIAFQEEETDSILDREAERQARRVAKLVQGNMALENQAVDQKCVESMVKRTKSELLAAAGKSLWYD